MNFFNCRIIILLAIFAYFPWFLQACNISHVELNALRDFYTLAGGPQWTWKTPYSSNGYPWDFTSSNPQPCDTSKPWQGITCYYSCTVQQLILSDYNLVGNLSPSLANLTNLNYFLLRYNPDLIGTVPTEIIFSKSIEIFDLTGNGFTGPLPSVFSNTSMIQQFYLGANYFTGTIPSSVFDMPYLYDLSIYDNQLTGTFPTFKNPSRYLRSIDISSNVITGTIPSSLGSILTLQSLDLNVNLFHGKIPKSLGNLTALYTLYLTRNLLTGPVPQEIFNNPSLQYLDLSSNRFSGTLPNTFGNAHSLNMVYFAHNSFSGPLPSSIGNLTSMTYFDISNNFFSDKLPQSIKSLRSIQTINTFNNSFSGRLDQVDWSNLTTLNVLTLSRNAFTSSIPNSFCNLSSLHQLDVSYNQLSGQLPHCIDQMASVTSLNFGNNRFTGTLPMEISSLPKLQQLILIYNQFTGPLPENIGELPVVQTLDFVYNNFTGQIPSSITNLSKLITLYFDYNNFTGTIPTGFSRLNRFVTFSIPNNQLHGTLPQDIFLNPTLQTFNIETNKVSGTIPIFSNASSLVELYLDDNNLTGSIPDFFDSMPNLIYFDLTDNTLTGTLPNSLYFLSQLQEISFGDNILSSTLSNNVQYLQSVDLFVLNNNRFTGLLPAGISQLNKLTEITLSYNFFTGNIPIEWANMTNLNYIQIDYNSLSSPFDPSLGYGLNNINLLTMTFNFIVSTIPESFVQWTSLQYLILGDNYLYGNFTMNVESWHILIYLTLNNNMLTGPINPTLNKLPYLQDLLLHHNQFTGTYDNLINNTFQQYLYSIDISNNQLTGSIPSTFFDNTTLVTFSLSQNCLQTSIPIDICQAPNLKILLLNGLHTGRNCFKSYLPALSSSYPLSISIIGSIPTCLYTMQSLQTFQAAGNGIQDKLPSSKDLWLQTQLVNLTLSHNMMTGTIPTGLQQKNNWEYLDLSFNKFSGTLSDQFGMNSSYHDSNTPSLVFSTSLQLQMNRLSGKLPPKLKELTDVNILRGNIFACSSDFYPFDHILNLPTNDSYANYYQCGSSAINEALYTYLLFVGIVCLIFGLFYVIYVYTNSIVKQSLSLYWNELYAWYSIQNYANVSLETTDNDQQTNHSLIKDKFPDIFIFLQEMQSIQTYSIRLLFVMICIFLPIYSIFSQYYNTYTYKYAWTLSMAFISGLVPSVLLFCLFLSFVYCFLLKSSYLFDVQFEQKCIQFIQRILLDESNQITLSSQSTNDTVNNNINEIESISNPINQMNHTVEENQIKKQPEEISSEKPSENDPEQGILPSNETIDTNNNNNNNNNNNAKESDKYKYFRQLCILLGLILGNISISLTINMVFIYYVNQNIQRSTLVLMTIALSIFKLFWSQIVVLSWLQQLMNRYCSYILEEHVKLSLLFYITIINNILSPFLASSFIDSNCFYYILTSPQSITSTSIDCFAPIEQLVYNGTEFLVPDVNETSCNITPDMLSSFSPPFIYSYQCSSTLLTNFASVFVYRYILSGVCTPLAVLMMFVYDIYSRNQRKQHGQSMSQSIDRSESVTSPKDSIVSMNIEHPSSLIQPSSSSLSGSKHHWILCQPIDFTSMITQSYHSFLLFKFDSNRWLITLLTDFATIFTFGAVFPPISLIIIFSIFINQLILRLRFGRHFYFAQQKKYYHSYLKELNQTCHEMGQTFFQLFPRITWFVTLFWSLFLFDTLGDSVGWKHSIWIIVLTIPFPFYVHSLEAILPHLKTKKITN